MKWFWNKSAEKKEKKTADAEQWIKCSECKEILYQDEVAKNLFVCTKCNFHFSINSDAYINLLLDENSFQEIDANMTSIDPLKFVDQKKYKDRLSSYEKITGLKSAVVRGLGNINKRPVSFGVMDFRFGGGSMGTVEGEKIARVFKTAIELRIPALMISKSGGARMQEGVLSLMQMAKTSAFAAQMAKEKIPYISLLTHPTTGGVSASFAFLGDIIIAEPKSVIGFAGSRVIRETIRESLPAGFQKSEFLMEKGFLDLIVSRKDLKQTIYQIMDHLMPWNGKNAISI